MRYLVLIMITMSMVLTSNAQFKMKKNGFGIHAGVTASGTYSLLDDFTYNDAIDPVRRLCHTPPPQIGAQWN